VLTHDTDVMLPEGTDDDNTTDDTYECLDCGTRLTADDRPGECPDCGGRLQNITVPRHR
jgi:rubrerythrin